MSTYLNEKLIQSASSEAFRQNVKTELEAGKSRKQALAIAYSIKKKNEALDSDSLEIVFEEPYYHIANFKVGKIWSRPFDSKEEAQEYLNTHKDIISNSLAESYDYVDYTEEAWMLNRIISSLNNEAGYYGTWLYIWPDGCSKEDCEYYFGEEDSYKELEDTFKRVYTNYHKDGLFDADKDVEEAAHEWDKKLGLDPIENLPNPSLKEDLDKKDLKDTIIDIFKKKSDEDFHSGDPYLFEVDDAEERAKEYKNDTPFWIKKFDDDEVDFSKLKVYDRTPEELKNGKYIATFMITGGKNGWGEWTNYLSKLTKAFKDLKKEANCDPLLYEIKTDICDDVWTGFVFVYKGRDNAIEESIQKFTEELQPKKAEYSRDAFETESGEEPLEENIEKHDTLNPVLFTEDEELKPEIKDAIEQIVDEFMSSLKDDDIKFDLKDIVLVGSNVSYNYTKDSDLDVHLVADSTNLTCPDNLYPSLYGAYRSIFNKNYDITIKGIPVELYVEIDEIAGVSNGEYSLKTGWIKKPEPRDIPELDEEEFNKEFSKWEKKYLDLIK